MLHDNIKLILSLAEQRVNDTDPSTQEGKDFRETLEHVRSALDDIQHDNYGQFVIYTGVFDKEHWGYEDEEDCGHPSFDPDCPACEKLRGQ